MDCKYVKEVSEDWILEQCSISSSDICVVEEVAVPGSIRQKISGGLGSSLVSFISLRHLDISRNNISSLDGLQYCKSLETINVYYNNISLLSEVLRLAQNPKLMDIDVRLNPVSVMSTEYRLMLVHALTSLTMLDKVAVTDKDRMLSLNYHSTDQANQLTGSHTEGERTQDCRLQSVSILEEERRSKVSSISGSIKSDDNSGSDSCEKFIKELRPPLTVLQPKRDAYDAYSTHGSFTPNPRRRTGAQGGDTVNTSIPSPLVEKYREGSAVLDENKKLREKCRNYKDKYNKVLSERISKESYVKLQEDYYKSLKRNEEMEEIQKTSCEEMAALKQHLEDLTKENRSLKQELVIKEQVTEVDKQIKVVCRELQDTLARDREKHVNQVEEFTAKYEDLAKTFTQTLANMEKRYEEEAAATSERHENEIKQCHDNFLKLQKLVDLSKVFGEAFKN